MHKKNTSCSFVLVDLTEVKWDRRTAALSQNRQSVQIGEHLVVVLVASS
jgi:hypothetical protein